MRVFASFESTTREWPSELAPRLVVEAERASEGAATSGLARELGPSVVVAGVGGQSVSEAVG